MGKKTDLTGQQFGRWTVLYRSETPAKDNRKKYVCECTCGAVKEVDGRQLSNGTSVSCGCYLVERTRERSTTHGMTETPTYRSWSGMKQRCTNPKNSEYYLYGGRGIGYDLSWESFDTFLADMGEAPEGMSIDRIDVDGDYCKENCRWANNGVQSHGRRKLIYKNTTNPSRFIGVVWHKASEMWRVKLVFEGKVIFDKRYPCEIQAAIIYDSISKEYYGDEPNKQLLANIV